MAKRQTEGVAATLLSAWTDSDTAMQIVGASLGVFGPDGADAIVALSSETPLRNAMFDILLSLVEGGALAMRPTDDGRYAFRWRADAPRAGLSPDGFTTIDLEPPSPHIAELLRVRAERDEAQRRAEYAEALAVERERLLRLAGVRGADEPTAVAPVIPEPATPEPATPEPATPEPATPEPATPEPATPEPVAAAPAAAAPVPDEPVAAEPVVVERPVAEERPAAKAAPPKPAAAKPRTGKPISVKEASARIAAAKALADGPAVAKPPVAKAVVPKPAAAKPEVIKRAAAKPEVVKAAAAKSVVPKPAAAKAVAAKATPIKPARNAPAPKATRLPRTEPAAADADELDIRETSEILYLTPPPPVAAVPPRATPRPTPPPARAEPDIDLVLEAQLIDDDSIDDDSIESGPARATEGASAEDTPKRSARRKWKARSHLSSVERLVDEG